MKAKDKIIGVCIFFPDVSQRNEGRKDRKKEKCSERGAWKSMNKQSFTSIH